MLDLVSDTAAYGGLSRGPEVFAHGARMAMQGILADIAHGRFAREWMRDGAGGGQRLAQLRNAAYSHPIEQTIAIIARALAPSEVHEGVAPAQPQPGSGEAAQDDAPPPAE
jgi:ketol-acid reductoisomerase